MKIHALKLFAAAALPAFVHAEIITKALNTDALDLPSSWVGEVVPGADDIAYFPVDFPNGTYTLGAQSWRGVYSDANVNNTYTFNSGSLTLGPAGFTTTANRNYSWNVPITLACPQVWSVASGVFVTTTAAMNGHELTLVGGGTKQMNGVFSNGSVVRLLAGNMSFNGGARMPEADVFIHNGNQLTIDLGMTGGAPRASNLHLQPGILRLNGDKNWETDTLAESLALDPGHSHIYIETRNAANKRLIAPTFAREDGATLLVRGVNLGVVELNSTDDAIKTSHLAFDSVPPLVGGAGAVGSTTRSIYPFMIGNTNITSTVRDYGATFATYDTAFGIQLLDDDEYASTLTDGQNTLENTRLFNASGAPVVLDITQRTMVNSLSLISTERFSGFEINGTGTLVLASGALLNRHAFSGSGTENDSRAVIAPAFLDLNENEGIFFYNLIGTDKGRGGAPLTFDTCITNDAGKGVTFAGLSDTSARLVSSVHGYTGPTRAGGGILWLDSPVPNTAVPGDLHINGGKVLNPGDQIPDTSDIHITAGQYIQRENLSDYGSTETFRDLIMFGGNYLDGTSFGNMAYTYLRNARLSGGVWDVSIKKRAEMSGDLTLSGGRITLAGGDSPGGIHGGVLFVGGDLTISNTPTARVYAPVTLGTTGTRAYISHLDLLGDFYFHGNTDNDTPAAIATSGAAVLGAIYLDGVRTFEINDGAAADDMAIEVEVADRLLSGVTTPGGIIKTGPGTLHLAAPTNTYTLATEIREGALAASGEFASAFSVSNNAVFNPRGAILNAPLTLADGAMLRFDLSRETPDFLAVNAAIINQGATHLDITLAEPADTAAAEEDYLLAVAVYITSSSFTYDLPPKWHVYTARNNTELRVGKVKNTIIMIR